MSIKVLVADDSITIQKVIGIIFGGDEFSLTIVDNGKSAVDKAREISPDILLIDALMPGMSGYEVCEAVRSTPALADKPILLLTGSFEPFDEEKAKECGADTFIAKPFESQQILTKVKELLALGKSRGGAVQMSPPSPPADIFVQQLEDATPPVPESPSPFAEQQPEAPTNIWSAFTPEIASEAAAGVAPVTAPTVPGSSAEASEPDVFAIVNEENDAQLVNTADTADVNQQLSSSQWLPVEEQTFEFIEETPEAPPLQDFSESPLPAEENAFGDISFADEAAPEPAPEPEPEPDMPVFAQPAPVAEAPAAPFAPLSDPAPPVAVAAALSAAASEPGATVPVALTEEQLRAAIAGASKEVIERIVWEIVPDLAEALIREAIRKITQET